MAELWVYNAAGVPKLITQMWLYDQGDTATLTPDTAVRVVEVWRHDGVQFKQVFSEAAPASGIVIGSPITHAPNQASSFIGLHSIRASLSGAGHIDGSNPDGTTSQNHSTSWTHLGDWFYPTGPTAGAYYLKVNTPTYADGLGNPLVEDKVNPTSYLYVGIHDGVSNLFSSDIVTNTPTIQDGSQITIGGVYPVGTVQEAMASGVVFYANYNGQLVFERTANFTVSIHKVADDVQVASWPMSMSINIYNSTGG